jgi:hypothetical protein
MSAVMQPKWIPVRQWAEQTYGDAKPHINTLLRWIHDGRIQPQPEKHGRGWRVRPFAEYKAD